MARKQKPDNDMVLSTGAAPRRTSAIAARPKHSAPPVESPVSSPIEARTQTSASVAHAEIAQLAYTYWEARGYQGGSSEEDWLRAEHELKARATAATA